MSGETPGPAADVYSFALLLWSLATMEEPWAGTQTWQVVSLVQNGARLEVPAADAVPGGAFSGGRAGGWGAQCIVLRVWRTMHGWKRTVHG